MKVDKGNMYSIYGNLHNMNMYNVNKLKTHSMPTDDLLR